MKPRVVPEIYALRPWYHDFRTLGLDTLFLDVPLTPHERMTRAADLLKSTLRRLARSSRTCAISVGPVGSIREVLHRLRSPHHLNQPVKEERIMEYVSRAIAELPPRLSCLELFCADGYYSCRIASLFSGVRVTGVDLDPHHIRRAKTVSRCLGLSHLTFLEEDVSRYLERQVERFDLILCAGGLYHSNDPKRLLESVSAASGGWVIVQSVITLVTEAPDYFVEPAPGWQHGSRFTHAWLRRSLGEVGITVVEETRAELPGNPRLHDRGSSFFLCRTV